MKRDDSRDIAASMRTVIELLQKFSLVAVDPPQDNALREAWGYLSNASRALQHYIVLRDSDQ